MASSASRLYHIVQSPRTGEPGPHPTLLLLHGRGAHELDLMPVADALDPCFLVISVRAPRPFFDGYCWYDFQTSGEPEPQSFTASLEALSQFVDELPSQHPVDAARIYTLGFSQGALMAGSLLLTRPKVQAGTVMLSGYLPVNSGLAIDTAGIAGRPVFMSHGTQDNIVPVAFGRAARDYLKRLGANVTYHEYPMAHQISAQTVTDLAAWLEQQLGKRG